VVLVLFATTPPKGIILVIVVALTVTMFTNLKFVHPVRTARWQRVTLPVALAWVVFAGWAAWVNFDEPAWVNWGLILTSLYLIFAGIVQQLLPQVRPVVRMP